MTNPKEEFENKILAAFTDSHDRYTFKMTLQAAHKSYLSSLIEKCEGMKRKRCEKGGYGHEHNPWGCQPDKPCAFCDHMEKGLCEGTGHSNEDVLTHNAAIDTIITKLKGEI